MRKLLELRATPGAQADVFFGSGAAPVLSKVDLLVAELAPGDGLFLPKRWLHDVESSTATASLACRFAPERRRRRRRRG